MTSDAANEPLEPLPNHSNAEPENSRAPEQSHTSAIETYSLPQHEPASAELMPPVQDAPMLEPQLFESWFQPEIHPPVRTPHLGHVCLLGVLALFGLLGATLLMQFALAMHLYGVTSLKSAITEVHYTLGSEVALYLVTFGACLAVFPAVWHKSFLAGVQWNGAVALQARRKLLGAAVACFLLALLNGILLPGPTDTPIDKIFRAPGAAWLLFGFGVTFAPFFEEMIFRGFLLPALCTACDWVVEQTTGSQPRPLDASGHPEWSMPAMVTGAVLTSIPFALMHGAQTGYSIGPFLLLVCVSLVLCWARLSTKSLAASVMVHASYNFLLFSLMMLGTEGFRHLDKM